MPETEDADIRLALRTIALALALLPNAYIVTVSVVLGFDRLPLMSGWVVPSVLAIVSIFATLRERRWGLAGYAAMTVVQLVVCVLAGAIARGVLLAVPLVGVVALSRRAPRR